MKCKRCGLCCYKIIVVDGVLTPTHIPCQYLIFKNKKAFCTIYKERLIRDMGDGNKCILRKDSLFDYEGCPYNTNKPLIKDWRKYDS